MSASSNPAAAQPLVRGALYRNPLGAELLAVRPAQESEPNTVFGDIWIVQRSDNLFGPTRHLATAEGLTVFGYSLVEQTEATE